MADNSLRVAFFAGAYEHIVDGVTLATHRQVNYLLARQIPVRVYAPSTGEAVLPAASELLRVPAIHLPSTDYCLALGLPRSIRHDLEAFRPTLLHLATPDWLGASAQAWARRRGIPVVATFHTHFINYMKHYRAGFLQPLAWRLLRRFYNRCNELFVPSASIAVELKAHGVRTPITLNPYGVDTRQFTPQQRSMDWRLQHGIACDEVVLAFVGRLVWEKGLEVFARTMARLDSLFLPHRALIVGEGPARNSFRQRLPRAVFTGRLSGSELATAFASADVFFFPSATETFGCVTVEALASGLPCVVADAPGSRDIVRNGVEGSVGVIDDDAAFAELLMPLIRQPLLRRSFAPAAVARAKAFTWGRVLQTMLSHFETHVHGMATPLQNVA